MEEGDNNVKYLICRDYETHRGGRQYHILGVTELPVEPKFYEFMSSKLYTFPEAVEKLKELTTKEVASK